MYVVGCNCVYEIKFIIGEYEFYSITAPKPNSRFPEYSMTNDPEKVWPGGIVYYVMDTSLRKFLMAWHLYM